MTIKDNGEALAQQAKSAGIQGDPKPTIELVTAKVPDGTPCPVIPRICIPDACVPTRSPWPRICDPTCGPPPPKPPKPN